MPSGRVVHATPSQLDHLLADPRPAILDFGAPRCAPCRRLLPVLEELAASHAGRVHVVSIDVDQFPALGQRFAVRSLPTLLAVQGGTVLAQQVGFGKRSRVEELFRLATAA